VIISTTGIRLSPDKTELGQMKIVITCNMAMNDLLKYFEKCVWIENVCQSEAEKKF
jgi:hypothetical protein